MFGNVFRRLAISSIGLLGGFCGGYHIKKRLTENRENIHIVLDIDHTLLHSLKTKNSNKLGDQNGMLDSEPDFQIDLGYDVRLRRFLYPTLMILNKVGNVHAFTMGTKDYADQILEKMDPNKEYFDLVFDRSHGLNINDRKFCKDLNLISMAKDLGTS